MKSSYLFRSLLGLLVILVFLPVWSHAFAYPNQYVLALTRSNQNNIIRYNSGIKNRGNQIQSLAATTFKFGDWLRTESVSRFRFFSFPLSTWLRTKSWKFGSIGALFLSVIPMAANASPFASTAGAAIAASPTISPFTAAPVISATVETQLTLRLVYAALMGAALGKERSAAKHSVGVRTMALVALGAASFTVCSAFGFLQHVGKYDPSRMAANVASGVGFVGTGVIATSARESQNMERSLTTAATIWLSAAVGVACGVGLYRIATTVTMGTIAIHRLGSQKSIIPTSQHVDDTNTFDRTSLHAVGANQDVRAVRIPATNAVPVVALSDASTSGEYSNSSQPVQLKPEESTNLTQPKDSNETETVIV